MLHPLFQEIINSHLPFKEKAEQNIDDLLETPITEEEKVDWALESMKSLTDKLDKAFNK